MPERKPNVRMSNRMQDKIRDRMSARKLRDMPNIGEPGRMSDRTSNFMPNRNLDRMPDRMLERKPKCISNRMLNRMSDRMSEENVRVGIARSEAIIHSFVFCYPLGQR